MTSLSTILAASTPPGSTSVPAGSTTDFFTIPRLTIFSNLGDLVGALLILVFFAASLAFLINLLIGGIQWMSAGGDPKALSSARNRIMNAVIGLVIVVAAFAISVIVTSALGVNIFANTITFGK